MTLLRAEDRVRPGRDVVDGEDARIACGDELAHGNTVVGAVADRQVVLGGARVHEKEDDLAVRNADARRIELELGHRDLGRTGRLARAAPTASCQQRCGGQTNRQTSHLPAVIPTYRIRNRKTQTTSTKCQ